MHASSDPDGLGIFDLRLYDYEGVLRVPLAMSKARRPVPRPFSPAPGPLLPHRAPSHPSRHAPSRQAERLDVAQSASTHAMLFVGADKVSEFDNYFGGDEVGSGFDGGPDEGEVVVDGTRVTRLRFENSWGGIGDSGHHTMSAAWFKEYVYHVAVDARFLPSKVLAALDDEPLVLPRWDPMGAVGCSAFGGHQHDDAAPAAKEKEDAPRHEVPDNTWPTAKP